MNKCVIDVNGRQDKQGKREMIFRSNKIILPKLN